jgi:hypothetical protein
MDNATFVFESLLRNCAFMDKVDTYVKSISDKNAINITQVPDLVFLLVTILESRIDKKLTPEETFNLLALFMNHIIGFYKEIDITNKEDFVKSYNICVNLALMKIRFKTKNVLSCL